MATLLFLGHFTSSVITIEIMDVIYQRRVTTQLGTVSPHISNLPIHVSSFNYITKSVTIRHKISMYNMRDIRASRKCNLSKKKNNKSITQNAIVCSNAGNINKSSIMFNKLVWRKTGKKTHLYVRVVLFEMTATLQPLYPWGCVQRGAETIAQSQSRCSWKTCIAVKVQQFTTSPVEGSSTGKHLSGTFPWC